MRNRLFSKVLILSLVLSSTLPSYAHSGDVSVWEDEWDEEYSTNSELLVPVTIGACVAGALVVAAAMSGTNTGERIIEFERNVKPEVKAPSTLRAKMDFHNLTPSERNTVEQYLIAYAHERELWNRVYKTAEEVGKELENATSVSSPELAKNISKLWNSSVANRRIDKLLVDDLRTHLKDLDADKLAANLASKLNDLEGFINGVEATELIQRAAVKTLKATQSIDFEEFMPFIERAVDEKVPAQYLVKTENNIIKAIKPAKIPGKNMVAAASVLSAVTLAGMGYRFFEACDAEDRTRIQQVANAKSPAAERVAQAAIEAEKAKASVTAGARQ